MVTPIQSALIFGGTGGIGRAVVAHLKNDLSLNTVDVLSRSLDGLDFTKPETIAALAQTHTPPAGGYDLIFNTVGVLEVAGIRPEKSFSELTPHALQEAFLINAMGPALIFKHFGQFLAKDRPAVFAHLSARIGSIGDNRLGGWISYRASKAALNQIIKSASLEFKRSHPLASCIALHPGTVETDLTRKYAAGRYTATPDIAAAQLITVMQGLTPQDSGRFLDYKGETIPW